MKNKIMKTKGKMAATMMAALLGLTSPTLAQNLGISATGVAPDASAGLDVNFTDRGVLIPRIALTSTTSAGPISTPANSLLVYNTTNNPSAGLTPGYYYNAGTPASPNWVRLLSGGTPSNAWLTLGNAGTNPATHFVGTTDNVDLAFRTNNTEKMRITAGGNVGIGTTSPAEKLHVEDGSILIEQTPSSPTTAPFLKFNGAPSHNMLGLRYYNPDNSTNKYVWWVPRDNALMVIEGGTTDGQFGTEYFRITETGNVGIGTTAPNRKLELVSDVSGLSFEAGTGSPNSGVIRFGDNSGWKLHFGRSRNSVGGPLNSGTAGVLMTIQDNGNVGIGTTVPTAMLTVGPNPQSILNANELFQIAKTGDAFMTIRDGSGIVLLGTTSGIPFVGSQNNVPFAIRTNDLIRVLINTAGNVGIGTTNPGHKLHVIGNVFATGVVYCNSSALCSDQRWKTNIKPIQNALDNVLKIQGVTYNWKVDEYPDKHFSKDEQIGFIAQEIEKIYPQVVLTDKDGYKSIDYSKLTPILVEAIKEQQKIIQELQAENAQIKAENTQTKSEVKALAEKMNILINTLSAEKKVGNK